MNVFVLRREGLLFNFRAGEVIIQRVAVINDLRRLVHNFGSYCTSKGARSNKRGAKKRPLQGAWFDWLRGVASIHRPPGYGPGELPGCSTPRCLPFCGKEYDREARRLCQTFLEKR